MLCCRRYDGRDLPLVGAHERYLRVRGDNRPRAAIDPGSYFTCCAARRMRVRVALIVHPEGLCAARCYGDVHASRRPVDRAHSRTNNARESVS